MGLIKLAKKLLSREAKPADGAAWVVVEKRYIYSPEYKGYIIPWYQLYHEGTLHDCENQRMIIEDKLTKAAISAVTMAPGSLKALPVIEVMKKAYFQAIVYGYKSYGL